MFITSQAECGKAGTALGVFNVHDEMPTGNGNRARNCGTFSGDQWLHYNSQLSGIHYGNGLAIVTTATSSIRMICVQAAPSTSWRPIFRQTHPFFQPTADWASYNPTETGAPNFSALDTLESCRDSQGKLHLKIVWPNRVSRNYNEWKQTSNPMDNPTVAGYEPVDIHFTDNRWGGLERQSGGEALLDGSVDDVKWFYAIGAMQEWSGGIPGASSPESAVELYAMCPGGKQPPPPSAHHHRS
jgi:hypothetical protein